MMSDAELTAAEAELTDMHQQIEWRNRKAIDLTQRIVAEYRRRGQQGASGTVHPIRPSTGTPEGV